MDCNINIQLVIVLDTVTDVTTAFNTTIIFFQ